MTSLNRIFGWIALVLITLVFLIGTHNSIWESVSGINSFNHSASRIPSFMIGRKETTLEGDRTSLNEKLDNGNFTIYGFNPAKGDIFIMQHIQKTGGTTFGKNLVRYLDTGYPCKAKGGKYNCFGPHGLPWIRNMWTHSQVMECDLHTDYTLTNKYMMKCLRDKYIFTIKPRPLIITMVREPTLRYISEWQAVTRGSNWFLESDMCANYHPLLGYVEKCPFRKNQQKAKSKKQKFKLSFDEFSNCPGNKANNRQTRMLANLTLLNCDQMNKTTFSQMQRNMLQSAKAILVQLAFFGMTEYQKETQLLFEATFNVYFKKPLDRSNKIISKDKKHNLTDAQISRIFSLNPLDYELYDFAKSIFFSRVQRARLKIQ